MESLGEGNTIRWTIVLGFSEEARTKTKLSRAVGRENTSSPQGTGTAEQQGRMCDALGQPSSIYCPIT